MIKRKVMDYLFIFFFFLLLFRDFFEYYLHIKLIGYSDEFISLLAFPLVIIELKDKYWKIKFDYRYDILINVIILVILGWLGSIIYNYQPFSIYMTDFLLIIKFWLALYVGHFFAYVCSDNVMNYLSKKANELILLFLFMVIFDLIFKVFPATYRFGLRSEQLFFSHPSSFCASLVILFSTYLIGLDSNAQPDFKILFSVFFLMCSTLRTKAIGASSLMIIIYYLLYVKKKKISLKTFLLLVPIAFFIAKDQIYFYFFSNIQSDSARYQLLIKSFSIALDHFPFGSGFGTFGSYASAVNYSKLYYIYGLSNVNGLSIDNISFICDSFWPMITAQFGFLGLLIYTRLLIVLFKKIQLVKGCHGFLYLGCVFIYIYLVIISVAESSFVNPITIPMAILLGFCFGKSENIDEFYK